MEPRPGETAEQRTVRHEREFKEAEAKVNAQAKDFPLITAPGSEKQQALFLAELAKLNDDPQFKRKAPAPSKLEPGKRPVPKTAAELRAERLAADLALMRKQSDKVLESQPKLRDFVEQYFQWHQRMFEVVGKYADNPKVRDLVASRLGPQPLAAK